MWVAVVVVVVVCACGEGDQLSYIRWLFIAATAAD